MSGGKANYEAYKRIQHESGNPIKKTWEGLTHTQRMGFEAGAQAAVATLLPSRAKFTEAEHAEADDDTGSPLLEI